MSEEIETVILAIMNVAIFIMVFIIFITLNEFYNDYRCSTTTDINYYIENKCERFNR